MEYNGIDWRGKDDIQRLLTVLEMDAICALNNVLQYKYVIGFTYENCDFINKSPNFWSEVITSLRYSMFMQTARLFDESREAVGITKALNILEQSKYRNMVYKTLLQVKKEYNGFTDVINSIRTMRDKVYAHNDKEFYRNWSYSKDEISDVLDDPLWGRLEELLRWAKNSIFALRCTYGDCYPIWYETKNDVGNILPPN